MAKRSSLPPEAVGLALGLIIVAGAYFLWQPTTGYSLLAKGLLIFFAGLSAGYNLLMLAAMGLGLYLRQRDPTVAGKPFGDKGRVFTAPRWHDAVVALICLSIPVGYDIWVFDAFPPVGVMLTVLFGFLALYNLAQVILPARLRLTEHGFEVQDAFGAFRRTIAWRDIEPVFVFEIGAPLPPGNVAYRFIEGREPMTLSWLQRSLANLRGGMFMLPLGLDLESVALRDLMNEMRRQVLAAADVKQDAAGEPISAGRTPTQAQRKHALAVYGHANSPIEAHQLFVRIGVLSVGGIVLMLAIVGAAFTAGHGGTKGSGPDQNIGAVVAMISIVWLIFTLSGQSTFSVTPRRGFVVAGLSTHPTLYWMTIATFALAGLTGAWLDIFRPFSH